MPPYRAERRAGRAIKHRLRAWLLLALAAACAASAAPSALAVTQDEVIARASILYAKRIAALAETHTLDASAPFSERIARIAGPLIVQAARDHP